MLLKEDVVPAYVTKPLYLLAPMIAIVAATIGFAVVPFGPVGTTAPTCRMPRRLPDRLPDRPVHRHRHRLRLRDRQPGGLRRDPGGLGVEQQVFVHRRPALERQLISYEIPLGLSILGMVLLAGSLDLNAIINWQDRHVWGIFAQPLGFLIFLVSAFAETNRLPFDLPESEQELVGGFHTEYSAMKFGMFFLGEYLHVITVSFLTVILFFGGWDLPFVLNQDQTGLVHRAGQDAGDAGQGRADDPLHDVGPLDAAAVPLRPAHGPGLEVADPAGARQPGGHGGDRAVDPGG